MGRSLSLSERGPGLGQRRQQWFGGAAGPPLSRRVSISGSGRDGAFGGVKAVQGSG